MSTKKKTSGHGEQHIYFSDRSFISVMSSVYHEAVQQLEDEGLSTSDAQGVVDAKILGNYRRIINQFCAKHAKLLLKLDDIIKILKKRGYPCSEFENSLKSVAQQKCTPLDVSNLNIFIKVATKIEDELSEEEVRELNSINKELINIIEAPLKWKIIL